MRAFKTVFMRGGTSKGLLFHKSDLPADPAEWDGIFLQAMGDPDPKQIDGMGGCVSSNNKVVVVWRSGEPDTDVEYLVGQVIVGKSQVDYKSNCGNMTACVGPFAVEEKLVDVTEPVTIVRMLNRNTEKRIEAAVPVENGTFAPDGDCKIAGVDGTAAEIKVNFVNPAGAKTGKLTPTGNPSDMLDIPGFGRIEATILDVSNPTVIVRAEDIGLQATELPDEVDGDGRIVDLLEKIRGTAACLMGFAGDVEDAARNSPAVPKVGFFSAPKDFADISGDPVDARDMDLCVRVISVFKCHRACPLTSAGAFAVAALLEGSVAHDAAAGSLAGKDRVRIGHPSGILTMYPQLARSEDGVAIQGIAVQRTARRIMDGTVYIRN